MEKCKNCNAELKSQDEQNAIYEQARKEPGHWSRFASSYCDGIMTYGTDPFAVEICNDSSESWNCEGGRYLSMMEI